MAKDLTRRRRQHTRDDALRHFFFAKALHGSGIVGLMCAEYVHSQFLNAVCLVSPASEREREGKRNKWRQWSRNIRIIITQLYIKGKHSHKPGGNSEKCWKLSLPFFVSVLSAFYVNLITCYFIIKNITGQNDILTQLLFYLLC